MAYRMDKTLTGRQQISTIVQEIRSVLDNARSNVARQVNSELLNTYWNIGRIICEYEQSEPGGLWQADVEGAFQGTDTGIRKRLFPL